MNKSTLLALAAALALAGCATATKPNEKQQSAAPIVDANSVPGGKSSRTATAQPATNAKQGGGYLAGDGHGTGAPENLDAIPDAVPKAEPLHRYANRPYSA